MTNFQAPQTNPFGLTNVGQDAKPTFVDIDGDGDLDAFIGNNVFGAPTDDLLYFENVGSASSPAFATPVSYPFGLTAQVTPQADFGDIDNDGDLDAFVGLNNGNTVFFENTGSATAPAFAAPTTNPFGLGDVGRLAAPELVDIDGDGDLDLFIGENNSVLNFFENTGSASSPTFVNRGSNPFGLTSPGGLNTRSSFVDFDGDGDFDAFVGSDNGTQFYENTGTASAPAFAAPVSNPFGLTVVPRSAPDLVDIDNDGDLDAFIGNASGDTVFFENVHPAPNLSIDLEKLVSVNGGTPVDADTAAEALQVTEGDDITYTFTLENNGNVDIDDFVLEDPSFSTVGGSGILATLGGGFGLATVDFIAFSGGDTDNDEILDVGETWTFTTIDTSTDDIKAQLGTVENTATVRPNSPNSTPFDTDSAFYEGSAPPTPSINLEKLVSANGGTPVDADTAAEALQVTVGDAITYTFTVENDGTVPILDFDLSDQGSAIASLVAGQGLVTLGVTFVGGDTDSDNILDPNEIWTFTSNNPVTAQTGTVENTASVTGVGGLNFSTDSAFYEGSPVANPSIDLTKFVNGEDRNDPSDPLPVTVGDAINYTYTVENTGDVAFSEVQLIDDNGTPGGGANASDDLGINVTNGSVSFQQGISFVGGDSNGNFVLDPGETWQFAADPQTAQSSLVTNLAEVGGSAGPGSTVTGDNDTASYEGSQTTPETEEFLAGFDCYLDVSALPTPDFTVQSVDLATASTTNGVYSLVRAGVNDGSNIPLGDNPEALYFPNALFDPETPFIDYAGGDDVVIGDTYFRDNLLLRFRAAGRGDITTEFGTGNDIFAMQDVVLQAPNLDHNFLLEDGDDTVIVQQISTQSSNTQAQFDLGAGNDVFGGFERFGTFSPGELRPDGIAAVVDGGTGTDTFFVPEGNVTFDITFENGSFILTDPNGVKMEVDNFETFKACTTDNTLTATELQTLVTNDTITNTQELLDQLENPPNPSIDLIKFVNGEDRNDPSDPLSVTVGDTINYTYTLENTGNVALSNVELLDDNGTPGGGANASDDLGIRIDNGAVDFQQGINFVGGDSNGDFVLDPGETWQFAADPQVTWEALSWTMPTPMITMELATLPHSMTSLPVPTVLKN